MTVNLATAEEFHAELARLRAEIARIHGVNDRLRLAINRLAMQDATLSVQGGNVTVTMDATLTPEEREAVEVVLRMCGDPSPVTAPLVFKYAATLRGLLERIK